MISIDQSSTQYNMETFVVIPCLNEAASILTTVRSLDFGPNSGLSATVHLVLVDNGSDDDTPQMISQIKNENRENRVLVGHEIQRGFVPARRSGVDVVKDFAIKNGICDTNCLILQADADADYSPGYIEKFSNLATTLGEGHLFEAESIPHACMSDHETELIRRLMKFDAEFIPEEQFGADCIVDDKMVGYLLSDWERVGGLQRDWVSGKEFIFCGTSRMWIQMLSHGFNRILVDGATCAHSMRKISEGADIFAATGGWPRGQIWKAKWRSRHPIAVSPNQLLSPQWESIYEVVLENRKQHLDAMFNFLPALVSRQTNLAGNLSPASIIFEAFMLAGIDLSVDFL